MPGVHRACAQKSKAEGFDNGRHRVGLQERLEARRNGRNRVNHRRGVHQQLHSKLHQKAQIAVLGGQRGNDDAKPQPQPCHHQQQQGRERHPGEIHANRRAAQGKEAHKAQKQHKLHQEGDEIGNEDGHRHRHPREVHLAEQMRILHKGIRGLVQALGKVGPDDRAGHVKEELRQSIGGQTGNPAEDHGKGDGGQQRLDEIPQGTQDGLLVSRHKIPAHKQQDEVAVAPQFAQAQIQQVALRLNDEIPVFGLGLERSGFVHIQKNRLTGALRPFDRKRAPAEGSPFCDAPDCLPALPGEGQSAR